MWNEYRIMAGWIILSLFALAVIGCGVSGGEKIEIHKLGFSMMPPWGWRSWGTEKKDRRDYIVKADFYDPAKRDDNFGDVSVFLFKKQTMEGQVIKPQTLTEYVEIELRESQKMESMFTGMSKGLEKAAPGDQKIEEQLPKNRIVSKTSKIISGLDAIQVIRDVGAYSVINVYIHKGNEVIVLMFRALKEDFPKYEKSLHKSTASIKIQE